MYKRRKKISQAASSTVLDGVSKSTAFSSSQSSLSSISAENRSDSPEDMFLEPTTSNLPVVRLSQNGKNSPQPSTSTENNLNIHLSTDDSEPSFLPPPSKVARTTNGFSQSAKRSQPQPSSSASGPLKNFYEMLSNAGIVIGTKGEPNFLKKSQFVFVRNLSRILNKTPSDSAAVKRFLENFEEYLSDTDTLIAALSPTKNHPDANLPGDCLESLVQLLLSIESIQPQIISFLLDKVAEYSVLGEESERSEEPLAVVRMLLHSMRYLSKVCQPQPFTQKLFDLIHSISSTMLKHEIISCLPDIISDGQREQTANELMDLMKGEPHLTPTILFTLSNLWLESETLSTLQLSLIPQLRRTSVDQLPAFVRFMLSGDINPHADEIINGLRSELVICQVEATSTQLKQTSPAELSSTLYLIFEKLRDSVLKSKKLADIWLKNIKKVKSAAYHKPIDLLMLLILHSLTCDPTRKKAVEAVYRSKIKIGHFTEELIKNTLTVGLAIIKEHFKGLLKLLSTLLVSQDVTVSEFSSKFYIECFILVDSMSRKMIILELKDTVRTSKENSKPVLNLLHQLASKHPKHVLPFFTLIMLLLDSVGEMRVCEVRQLMDALCFLAFGGSELEDSSSSFDQRSTQDELSMIVQKQLAHPEPRMPSNYTIESRYYLLPLYHGYVPDFEVRPVFLCPLYRLFRSGIVSGIVIIKHMVQMKDNQVNETPSSELDDIPLSQAATNALNLFELVLMSTRNCSEAQVLVFDQFSHVIMTCENMDKCFMKKISVLLQYQLQNHFIITSSEYRPKDDRLEPVLQFCIDTDFEDPIVFNLVDAVIAESKTSQVSIPLVALPGLVRAIRGLELSDLTEIDALLGCAVALPSARLLTSGYPGLEPSLQRLALDCLFHVSNWMREMLNSFVVLVKEGSPDKVLKRLRAIVHFQNLIAHCLPHAINYTPPKCYFEDGEKKSTASLEKKTKTGPGRRKQKKDAKQKEDKDEDENNADETSVASDEEREEELICLEYSKFKNHLRELDFDVCLILTQPLTLTPQPIKDGECSAELGPTELLLLLEDLDSKLRYVLGPRKMSRFTTSRSSVGFDNLSSVPIDLIVRNTSKLVPLLLSHLQKIIEYLHNLITEHDGIMDAPGMFCPGSYEIKQCLALIFSILNTYLGWPDLESEAYVKYLMKCLVKMNGPNGEKTSTTTKNAAAKGALVYLKDLRKCVVDLTSAVSLVNLIKTIEYLQDDEDRFDPGLASICGELLGRRWYDGKGAPEKGPKVNGQQGLLLEMYLSSSAHISSLLSSLAEQADGLTSNEATFSLFPHFNRSNLNVLIRSLCAGLLASLKQKLEQQDPKSQLEVWDSVFNNLQLLIAVIKIHDSRINLRHFLKGCLPIMRYFLTHGMSVCSMMFKIESMEVSQTIKKLQVITRYIQSICNYSKVNKDNSLILQLPGMRGTLEKILLSVKNMVLQNKCTDAFFMGSMKHKDIHGEIISTQEGDSEGRGDSEEIPTVEGNESANEESTHEEEDQDGSMSDTC